MTRVALITGGSRGIGRSFAEALLSEGLDVCITGARDQTALEHAVEELRVLHPGQQVRGVMADAGQVADAGRAVSETLRELGRLDILVNNAGRGPRELRDDFHINPPKFWEIDPDGWAEIVQSNVNGPFLMTRAAAPHMRRAGWGRIIGISTSAVTMTRPGFAPYGPTKAALDTMTAIFAQDLAGSGVTCNILAPGGPTETDFIPPQGRSGRYAQLLPVDVMNDALLWLCSSQADAVTGARFIGKLWDPKAPEAAREDTGQPPRIL